MACLFLIIPGEVSLYGNIENNNSLIFEHNVENVLKWLEFNEAG